MDAAKACIAKCHEFIDNPPKFECKADALEFDIIKDAVLWMEGHILGTHDYSIIHTYYAALKEILQKALKEDISSDSVLCMQGYVGIIERLSRVDTYVVNNFTHYEKTYVSSSENIRDFIHAMLKLYECMPSKIKQLDMLTHETRSITAWLGDNGNRADVPEFLEHVDRVLALGW